jgi:hypothetical protein
MIMRKLIFAFFGAMGLTLLTLPIAVHQRHSDAGAAQQLIVPVSLTSVADVGQIAADSQNDRADQDAKDGREQPASSEKAKEPAAEPSDPRPATHQRQKTINVDLSDLVIRPV